MPQTSVPFDDRVRRYPVGFVFEGGDGLAVNPSTMVLVPLRLVVCEPSRDALLIVRWGEAEMSCSGWCFPDEHEGHSRALPTAYWRPGTKATIDVRQGTVKGAAFVCEAARHAPVGKLP